LPCRCASRSAGPANRGSLSPALSLARARAGTAAGGGKADISGVFVEVPAIPPAAPLRSGNSLAELGERVENEGRIAANHFAMMGLWRRFVSSFVGLSALLVVWEECPISFQYQTLIDNKIL